MTSSNPALRRPAVQNVIAIVLASAAISGCVGRRPDPPAIAAIQTPDAWRTAAGSVPVPVDWWNTFGDPQLTALVQRALENNSDIGMAAARVAEARAVARSARAQQAPYATGGGSVSDGRTIVLGQGSDAFSGAPQAAISYDLDLFGRLSAATGSARAALLAAADTRDAVALAIASTTASGYIALRSLDSRLATTKSALDLRADALRLAKRRADSGYGSRLELYQAEAEYRAAEQLVPTVQLAIARQENALCVILGEPPHAIPRGVELDRFRLPDVPGGLPSTLLRRRPDLAAAEASLVAADRSLDSARAALLPNVALTGTAGIALSTALADPITLFSLGGSILAPLFDGGRLRAQADAATARRDQAAFAYRRTALGAFREVDDALVSVDRLAGQERSVDEQVIALAQAVQVATKRYREGYSPFLDQIDAQRGLLSAQLVAIQTRSDRLTSAVTLYQALGGGWLPNDTSRATMNRPSG